MSEVSPGAINNSEQHRIKALYEQGSVALLAGLINAAVYVFVSRNTISPSKLYFWGVLYFSIFGLRLIFQQWFKAKYITGNKYFNPKIFEGLFVVGVFFGTASWVIAGTYLMPEVLTHQVFFGFILAGLTAGGIVAYGTSMNSMLVVLLPCVITFSIKLASFGGETQNVMAALLCAYAVLMSVLAVRINKYIVRSIQLHFEKEILSTELKATQTKIIAAEKMVALGEMAGGIAHEINNPLTIIQLNMSSLKEMKKRGAVDLETIDTVVAKIDSTLSRITKIVSGLRSFARKGNHDPFKLTSVQQLVTETLDFCQARFKNHEISLSIDAVPNDLMVVCRSVQISQVLVNLLNNAFDAVYGRTDSWVKLEIKADNSSVTLAVIDNGSGIPEDIREKIMQPFFTTKPVGKGTGLGLSISKGIIAEHDGQMYLDASSPYTRFVIILPRAVAAVEKIAI